MSHSSRSDLPLMIPPQVGLLYCMRLEWVLLNGKANFFRGCGVGVDWCGAHDYTSGNALKLVACSSTAEQGAWSGECRHEPGGGAACLCERLAGLPHRVTSCESRTQYLRKFGERYRWSSMLHPRQRRAKPRKGKV